MDKFKKRFFLFLDIYLNLTIQEQVPNHFVHHVHLDTLLVGVVGVHKVEIPPSEATLGVFEVGGGLRVEDDDVVGFGVFVQVGLGDVVHSDEVGLLGAAVPVEVEVALDGGASDDGVRTDDGNCAALRRNVDVTFAGHGVASSVGAVLGLVEGVEVAQFHCALIGVEGGDVLAEAGHVTPSARKVLTGKIVTAVVDVGFAEVRAIVTVFVGDPGVFGGIVEDGLNVRGTDVLVHLGNILHDALNDNGVGSSRPQVVVVVLDVGGWVNEAFSSVEVDCVDDVGNADEFGAAHAFESISDHSLSAVVRDTSDDTSCVDFRREGDVILDSECSTSGDTRNCEGVVSGFGRKSADFDGVETLFGSNNSQTQCNKNCEEEFGDVHYVFLLRKRILV